MIEFLLNWLAGKARDSAMVVATVVLFLANTTLSTVITIAWARGSERVIPQLAFFFSTAGRLLGELLAFAFSVSLFYVTYRYASVRRLPWRTALLASTFTAVLFEVAKRLYGLVEGDLLWTFDKAAGGHPLQNHLWARLRRA